MKSREVRPGMTIRVREDRRRPELEGMLGKVLKSYGAPEYPAVDVLLEDGQPELFWFHQLEPANESLLAHLAAFYDGT